MGTSWLACFLRKQIFEEIVQDKKLKDSILKENPVPTNITKPRKLDKYYKELLEKHPAKGEYALYGALEKKQSKILNIIGPLCKLYFRFEKAQENNIDRS